MPSPVLTDGATFVCGHQGQGKLTTGFSVTATASNVTIGGQKPILAGASILGFTAASGCIFNILGTAAPCIGFSLPPPSGQALTIGGMPVYTAADLAAIALVPSTGNGQPGLQIKETQTLVSA